MSAAIRFLHAFAQALSTLSLYSPGHPATRRTTESAWRALHALLVVDPRPVFFFLGGAPVFAGRALHELRDWPWSRRLAAAGVQRIEFDERLSVDGIAQLFDRLMARLNSENSAVDETLASIDGVLFGAVAVQDEVESVDDGPGAAIVAGSKELQVDLTDELEAMSYVRRQAALGVVARGEADAIVRILGALLDEHVLPQAAPGNAAYPVLHAVNTALLAMSAASWAEMDGDARHRVGFAALLHDIGMTRLPEGLGEQASLTADERLAVETHTTLGARLLLESGGAGLALAATVAYEHHLRVDVGGYPTRHFPIAPHWVSSLVAVASGFVALRSPRPYRPAWSAERTLRYLKDGAGTVFDADSARLVAAVVRPG